MKKYGQSDGEIKQFAYDVFCGLNGTRLPVFLCVGCDKYVCVNENQINKLAKMFKMSSFMHKITY